MLSYLYHITSKHTPTLPLHNSDVVCSTPVEGEATLS